MISSSSLGVSFTGQFYYTINALTPCPVNTNRHAVPVEMLQHQLLTQAQSPEEATALVESYTLSPGSEGLAYTRIRRQHQRRRPASSAGHAASYYHHRDQCREADVPRCR